MEFTTEGNEFVIYDQQNNQIHKMNNESINFMYGKNVIPIGYRGNDLIIDGKGYSWIENSIMVKKGVKQVSLDFKYLKNKL